MKKLMINWVAGVFLASSLIGNAMAETKPIQFPKGKSSATVTGTVKGSDDMNYVLRAGSGQTLNVDFKASKGAAFFSVLGSGGAPALFDGMSGGNHFSGTLPSDGDYTISVYLKGGAKESDKPVGFTLKVAIPASPSSGGAAGKSSETGAAEKACLAAVAKQVGKQSSLLKVEDVSVSEAATVVMVKVPEATAPWKCFSDKKGKVSGVEFSGSEGAL